MERDGQAEMEAAIISSASSLDIPVRVGAVLSYVGALPSRANDLESLTIYCNQHNEKRPLSELAEENPGMFNVVLRPCRIEAPGGRQSWTVFVGQCPACNAILYAADFPSEPATAEF